MGRAPVIVLDTHALVWLASSPAKLGTKATRKLVSSDRIGVPAICLWEIAMLVTAKRLRLDRPTAAWLDALFDDDERLEIISISPAIAADAAELSWKHRDPADRLVVATARVLDAPLVTADAKITESRLVRVVWD